MRNVHAPSAATLLIALLMGILVVIYGMQVYRVRISESNGTLNVIGSSVDISAFVPQHQVALLFTIQPLYITFNPHYIIQIILATRQLLCIRPETAFDTKFLHSKVAGIRPHLIKQLHYVHNTRSSTGIHLDFLAFNVAAIWSTELSI
jgi:hypothetical protein